jgi:chemotaxis protein MotB
MRRKTFPLVCVGLGLAGCVSNTTHLAALDQVRRSTREQARAACDKDKAALKAKRDADVARLEQERQKLADELAASQKQTADLEAQCQSKLKATAEELAELRKQRAAVEARLAEFKAITDKFRKMIDTGSVRVYIRRGRMILALPSSVLFPSGKADLSDRGKKTLAEMARTLQGFPKRRFLVAGHTDNVPVGAELGFADNWELSTARALVVTRFLVENGVPPRNLAAVGYGKHDPVRSNRTRRGRRLNRRIELILVPDLSELPKLPPPKKGS